MRKTWVLRLYSIIACLDIEHLALLLAFGEGLLEGAEPKISTATQARAK